MDRTIILTEMKQKVLLHLEVYGIVTPFHITQIPTRSREKERWGGGETLEKTSGRFLKEKV